MWYKDMEQFIGIPCETRALIPNLTTFPFMKAQVAPVKHWRKRTCGEDYRLRISPRNGFLKISLLPETSKLGTASLGQQPSHDVLLVIFFVLFVGGRYKRINWIKCPRWKAFVIREEAKASKKGRNQIYPSLKYTQEYPSCHLSEVRTSEPRKSILNPL